MMPNVKSGTLVRQDEIIEQVRQSKQGMIEFRVTPASFIMSKIGKRSFEEDKLASNFDALMMALIDRKPESVKGRYLQKAMLKSSWGPAIPIDISKYNAIVAQKSSL